MLFTIRSTKNQNLDLINETMVGYGDGVHHVHTHSFGDRTFLINSTVELGQEMTGICYNTIPIKLYTFVDHVEYGARVIRFCSIDL